MKREETSKMLERNKYTWIVLNGQSPIYRCKLKYCNGVKITKKRTKNKKKTKLEQGDKTKRRENDT